MKAVNNKRYSLVKNISQDSNALNSFGDFTSLDDAIREMHKLSKNTMSTIIFDDKYLEDFKKLGYSILAIKEQKFLDDCFIGYENIVNTPILLINNKE